MPPLDAATRESVLAALRGRRQAIAASWQGALARTSFVPLSGQRVRQHLLAATDQAIAALLAEPFARDAARASGTTLARLYYGHPDVLGGTLEVLGGALVADLPAAHLAALQPRLAALLGDVAAGFAAQARDTILAEQETTRSAALAARRQAEEALRASEARFRAVYDGAAIGIGVATPDGRVLETNAAMQAMFGYSGDEMRGLVVTAQFAHPDDAAADWGLYQELVAGHRNHFAIEKRFYRKDGRLIWTHLTVSLVRDAAGRPQFVIAMMEDISERKGAEEALRASEARLAHQAFHDPLTGLPNRALFADRLDHAVTRAGWRPGAVAVLFLDLDRFKVVNDSLGHAAGDHLLVAVAARLQACLRPADTVARLGGDEFTILLEDLVDPCEALRAAERITAGLRAPFVVGGHEVFVTASIGIASNTAARARPTDLLRDADTAMYRAKGAGRARSAVFDRDMNAAAVARLELETALRRALDRDAPGEFPLHYQPQVDLATGRLAGLEALVRWEHPLRGLLPPGEFIPLAEETGLILPLGRRVLAEACRQARRWQERHPAAPPPTIGVNLSARQLLQPDLAADVAGILRATGLAPGHLRLELTESVLLTGVQSGSRALQALRDLGVELAIDDFGTGYSSLGYLKHLLVQMLKIDRTFVAGLGRAGGDAAIVQAIITLARTLGLAVTAEGVETAAQRAQLRALGCDLGQGTYFAPPLAPDAIDALLGGEAATVGAVPTSAGHQTA